ncbi:hypothetical protein [Caulobacter endophyticus]|uniref:hypothetical protein n=1 Tax=Caulobacter endophyticus TaxID=2172652 RepID=UPI0011B1E228|nr:hypothetical protein [Caulobacter endophyticus]
MTLIVGYQHREHGMWLLGDALLTTDYPFNGDSPIPTSPLPNEAIWEKSFRVVGLFPKVLIVAPHLAVAWCGNLSAAMLWIDRLRDEFSSPRHGEEYSNYINANPPNNFSCILLCSYTSDDETHTFIVCSDGVLTTQNAARSIAVDGSGADHFIRTFHSSVESRNPEDSDRNITFKLLSYANRFMVEQQYEAAKSIATRAGGYFDLVHMRMDGSLARVSPVLFWHLEILFDGDAISIGELGNLYHISHSREGVALVTSSLGNERCEWIIHPPSSDGEMPEGLRDGETIVEYAIISIHERATGKNADIAYAKGDGPGRVFLEMNGRRRKVGLDLEYFTPLFRSALERAVPLSQAEAP